MMLELKNVSTSYGKIRMLKNVSLWVKKGEIVCLLGSNGAGKSTTIKTVIGLIKPDEGEIYFEKKRIDRAKTHEIIRSGISIVPEGRRIFPKMSTYENLNIGIMDVHDELKNKKLRQRVYDLFPILEERLSQNAGTLSGGEQAMLSIGRALMQDPKLIILDEPSFGLAPLLIEEFYKTISKLRDRGTTILLSEQNAGKALSVADRGYVLQKGTIPISGKTEELMKNDVVKKAYLGQ